LKAYIARSLYGNSGFYPIINETDEIYMTALKQFAKAKALAGEQPEKNKK
jgi:carboxyl-terminal processing protease